MPKKETSKYKRLIESLENEYFFYSHTLDGKYLYISPSVEKILGYTVEEAFGGLVKHMTDSERNKQTLEVLQKSASGEKQKTFQLELFAKNGEVKVIEITESPLYDDGGELISVEGVAHDITERRASEDIIRQKNEELLLQKKELEETLQNLKETQSQLVHSEKMGALGNLIAGIAHEINTPLGAITASVDNIGISIDASMKNLFTLFTKLTKKELLVFLRIMELIVVERRNITSKEMRQYKREIKAIFDERGCENSFAMAELIVYLNLQDELDKLLPMLNVDNPVFILQSIKNIYSVRKNTENIKLAVEKASKVVFALKKFSHKDREGDKEKTNIADNIETVLTLYHNRLKQGIEIVREYEDVPMIDCYPDELVQVWTNLISNAIQAMDDSGTLTIAVKEHVKGVQVRISDTGCGIPEEIRDRIFEPFFTTKKAGEGTGLGLDLVLKIVQKHGATIDLSSEVGSGTTFVITLPN